MTRTWRGRWPVLGLAAGVSLACSAGSRRGPAWSGNTSGQGVAHSSAGDVRVYADGSGWMGAGVELARVTPVRLRIENDGPWPLRVRYAAAALVSAAGKTFRAIPPFDVRDSDHPRLVPRFAHENVAVAPYLASVYDELPAESSLLAFDYHDDAYDHWGRGLFAPPSRFMREVAMPEAKVRPRGVLSGFLYFERVPERLQQVTLSLDLVNAETGQRVETIFIPLLVD